MRENKILENITVLNKVDNRQYLITSVTDGVGTACLLENGEVNEDISVMISSSNAIAFRLISNPNVPDIPDGYSVEDGILLKDGVAATQQGSLVIKSIVTSVPGKLLLAVLPRENTTEHDDYIDLFAYKPDEDKFKKLIPVSIPMPEVIGVCDKYVILKTSYTHFETKKDCNGKDIFAEYFDNAEIIVYDGAKNYISSYLMLDAPINNVITVRNSMNVPTWVIEYTEQVCDNNYYNPNCDCGYDCENDCGDYDECNNCDYHLDTITNTKELIEMDHIKAEMIALNGGTLMRLNSINIPSHIKSVSIGWNSADFIRLEDRIMIGEYVDKIITDSKIMSAVEGYDWIVDTSKEDNVTRIALANDNMEIKYIVISETSDRGDIVKVE